MSTAAWIPAEIRTSGSKPACGLATEPAPLTTVATALRAAQYFSYRMMSASPLCLRARAEKASPRCFLLTAAMTDDIESRVGLRRNLARSFATRGPAPRLPTSSRTRPDACLGWERDQPGALLDRYLEALGELVDDPLAMHGRITATACSSLRCVHLSNLRPQLSLGVSAHRSDTAVTTDTEARLRHRQSALNGAHVWLVQEQLLVMLCLRRPAGRVVTTHCAYRTTRRVAASSARQFCPHDVQGVHEDASSRRPARLARGVRCTSAASSLAKVAASREET
eukprot:scaffold3588_cov67-Phaeocystis_antarctica.AAC.10